MTAVLLSPLFEQFEDNNGAPLVGGKIYSYLAGTLTPQNTYTDATGVTPAANPIILNSAGRPTGGVWGSGVYKFILKDSLDNTIDTLDNVTAIYGSGDMTKAVYDPANIAQQVVGTTAVQTLTNKTLTSPVINSPTITGATGISSILNAQSTVLDVSNSVTESPIYSYSVAGGTLGTTGSLSLNLTGDYLNNTGAGSTLTINIKYGATTLGTFVLGSQAQSANRRSVEVDCFLSAANATGAQVSRSRVSLGATGSATGTGISPAVNQDAVNNAVAVDSTTAQIFQVTVTHGTVSASISCRSLNATLVRV